MNRLPALIAAGALVLSACTLAVPYSTDGVTKVSETTVDGYRLEYFESREHTCGTSGYQTLVVASPIGVPDTEARPLWVRFHGGGAGAFYVACSLARLGTPVTGVIMDSGVANGAYVDATEGFQAADPITCAGTSLDGQDFDARRRRFAHLWVPPWGPGALVSEGHFTTPLFHLWARRDPSCCSDVPIPYVGPGGEIATMGSADLLDDPLARAIAGRPPAGDSVSMRVCTLLGSGECGTHTPTTDDGVDADTGADYNALIMAWVSRLGRR